MSWDFHFGVFGGQRVQIQCILGVVILGIVLNFHELDQPKCFAPGNQQESA